MRILLGVPEFPPHHIGWWGVVFESLAKEYQKLWHDVLVISGDYTKNNIFSLLVEKKENGINIIRVPEFWTPIKVLNTVMPYPCRYNRRIKNIIENFNPDFVHIHWYGLFMPAQLANVVYGLWYKYVLTLHWAPVTPEKIKNILISWWYGFYNKFYGDDLLNNATSITAVSHYAKNFWVFEKYKNSIHVIWNGIIPEDYSSRAQIGVLQKYRIKKNKNSKIILSLWRLERRKGFQEIIKKLPAMEKSYDVRYVIGGRDNGYKNELLKLAQKLWVEKRLYFIDFVSGEEKNSLIEESDIFAVPSISGETFWISALEARYFKKPILTTFFWWLKDALKNYEHAYCIDEREKAFKPQIIQDEKIDEFFYKSIVKQYLSL